MAEHCKRPMVYDAASDTVLCTKCKQVWIAANFVPVAVETPELEPSALVESPSYDEGNRTLFVAMGRQDLADRLVDATSPAAAPVESPPVAVPTRAAVRKRRR